MNKLKLILILAQATLWVACVHKEESYAPKPKGYFRIELPEHSYQKMDTILPFTFDIAQTAKVSFQQKEDEKYWINVDYPSLNAVFNMTYFPLHNDLRDLALAEERMVKFHIDHGKADDVQYSLVADDANRVFGRIYEIEGAEAACPLQFWTTDSVNHFLRASIYFNFAPNNDSLAPVIQYLKEDALKIINTLSWK